MEVEVKQMSTKDRLERKKYMGMWRWGSELTARMMRAVFPTQWLGTCGEKAQIWEVAALVSFIIPGEEILLFAYHSLVSCGECDKIVQFSQKLAFQTQLKFYNLYFALKNSVSIFFNEISMSRDHPCHLWIGLLVSVSHTSSVIIQSAAYHIRAFGLLCSALCLCVCALAHVCMLACANMYCLLRCAEIWVIGKRYVLLWDTVQNLSNQLLNCNNSFQKRPVSAQGKEMWIKSSAEEAGCREYRQQGVQTQETTSSFSIKMWPQLGRDPICFIHSVVSSIWALI